MRNNLRSLLTVPALAIAAMAFTTTSADAQCPGGCFGYPTPSQPTFRAYAPAVQYQRVEVAPVQTFVQPQVFVAPEFIPTQTFVQPEIIIAPQQLVPAPIQQTFVSQPALVESGIMSVPQNVTHPVYPGLPAGAFNVDPILPTSSPVPVEQPAAVDAGSQVIPPVTKPTGAMEEGSIENVQEGQIEGEIISPAEEPSSTSVMEPDNVGDVPLTAALGLAADEEAKEAAMKEAAMKEAAMKEAAMKEAAMKETAMKEAAMKEAAMKETAMKEAAMKEAAMKEAAMKEAEMEAAERKAAMERAAERKEAEEKADKKVLTKEQRIANLENSLKRQIKRAKQVSKRELGDKLKELEADDATDELIEAAKEESATALKAKIAEIEKRVQARIDRLKN